ncbi:MAG: MASE1 domain-containing protein, partial [Planctomycetes bacterium]|nr:MASE1 domain-containing protein [Planctomycetota bacterium]
MSVRDLARPPLRSVRTIASVAGGYVFVGWLQQLLAPPSEVVMAWPLGAAAAALVASGPRCWPGVLLGSLVLCAATGTAPALAAAIAAGHTLAAVAGAWLLRESSG